MSRITNVNRVCNLVSSASVVDTAVGVFRDGICLREHVIKGTARFITLKGN